MKVEWDDVGCRVKLTAETPAEALRLGMAVGRGDASNDFEFGAGESIFIAL